MVFELEKAKTSLQRWVGALISNKIPKVDQVRMWWSMHACVSAHTCVFLKSCGMVTLGQYRQISLRLPACLPGSPVFNGWCHTRHAWDQHLLSPCPFCLIYHRMVLQEECRLEMQSGKNVQFRGGGGGSFVQWLLEAEVGFAMGQNHVGVDRSLGVSLLEWSQKSH